MILRFFAILAVISSQAHATTIINFTSVTGTFSDSIHRVIGWDFTTTSTQVYLTGLSFFDAGQDGLLGSHQVALYDTTTKALITSATVPAGSAATLDGFFRTVVVSPVALALNHSYTIAATWNANSDPWVWDDGLLGVSMTGFTSAPWIVTGTQPGRYNDFTSLLAFPNNQIADSRNWFVGPNGVLSLAVPEPSGALLLALGCAFGLVSRRR
jgi:hypothetical protein